VTETVAEYFFCRHAFFKLRICWGMTGTGLWDGSRAYPIIGVETGSGIIWQDIETVRVRDGCQCIAVSRPDLVIDVSEGLVVYDVF
jgi:hypothetical protein